MKRKYRAQVVCTVLLLLVAVIVGTVALAGNGALSGSPDYGTVHNGSESPEPYDPELEYEIEPEPELSLEPVRFNFPSEVRGVFLVPGQDYITDPSASVETIRGEIREAIGEAVELTMNTVIIVTDFGDTVIYNTQDAPSFTHELDIMQYVVDTARSAGLYVYAVFNASHFSGQSSAVTTMAAGSGGANSLSTNAREFAERYRLDGILLDGYMNLRDESSFLLYTRTGSGMGFDNFMRHGPETTITTAARAIRQGYRNTKVGLLADAVWENASSNQLGSQTSAEFTSLGDGNADTKAFVQNGLVDFVAVRAFGSLTNRTEPFGEVARWWANVAGSAGVPLYIIHASGNMVSQEYGWGSHDQLARQIIDLEEIPAVRGSIFNNMQRLSANPNNATTTLLGYYQNEIEARHILTELAVTRPAQTTFTTSESSVTFTGASDPTAQVTINGTVIPTDASGYFTVQMELRGGANQFIIEHKERRVTYSITREIEILREITPQGTLTADGSMDITITAIAHYGATVSATIAGTTIAMEIDEEGVVDEAERDSTFRRFIGVFRAPAGTAEEQNLGNIVVNASWHGESASLQGANVRINKRVPVQDGVPIVVIADQARTFPPNTLNNIPHSNFFPLPRGALDYAVSSELTFVDARGRRHTYFVLASGLRVRSEDIQTTSDFADGNIIRSLGVEVHSGFTFVTLQMDQRVSYTLNYSADGITIQFHNTVAAPQSAQLPTNPLFTQATWTDSSRLELSFVRRGGFMGYRAFFDDQGNLVLRFNNPPASIAGARIVIDPGHGGSDPGALGFHREFPESVVNRMIATRLRHELERRGATVLLLDTTNGMSLDERVSRAEQWNAHMLISIHNNASPNANATGTEVFFFNAYSRPLAAAASANVARALNTNNRGGRASFYNVTLSPQFVSVLVEGGFMTNLAEYNKLIQASYQQRMAAGIADAVETAISTAFTGISGGTPAGGSSTAPQLSGGPSIPLPPELAQNQPPTQPPSIPIPPQAPPTQPPANQTPPPQTTPPSSIPLPPHLQTNQPPPPQVPPAVPPSGGQGSSSNQDPEVYFEADRILLTTGTSTTLVVRGEAGVLNNSDFEWESEDGAIVTVNQNGVVTARAREGTARIFAVSRDGQHGIFIEVEVTTRRVTVESVWVNESEITMIEGTTWSGLEVSTTPPNIANLDVTFTSTASTRVSVDRNGVIRAQRAGSADIRVRAGNVHYTIRVHVIPLRDIDQIWLDFNNYNAYVGENFEIEAILPDDIIGDDLFRWRSSAPDIVRVNANGTFTALRQGTAVLTCSLRLRDNVYEIVEVRVH